MFHMAAYRCHAFQYFSWSLVVLVVTLASIACQSDMKSLDASILEEGLIRSKSYSMGVGNDFENIK